MVNNNCGGNGRLVQKMLGSFSENDKPSYLINANILVSKILSVHTWLDGNILVVSRDQIIDIINEMKNESTI